MHVELLLEVDAREYEKLDQMQCDRDEAGDRVGEEVTDCGYNIMMHQLRS